MTVLVATSVNQPNIYNAPVIIMNEGGCYDPLIKALRRMENAGLFKNINTAGYLPAPTDLPNYVRHQGTLYYDVLSTDSLQQRASLVSGVERVLAHRIRLHTRSQAPRLNVNTPPQDTTLTPTSPGRFTVGFYTNAGNDNAIIKRHNHALAQHAASLGYDIIYGAGDRFGMGAVYEGALAGRASCQSPGALIGVTTEVIVTSETSTRTVPSGCTRAIITQDIDTRTDEVMRPAHLLIATAGGVGTAIEIGKTLLDPTKILLIHDAALHPGQKTASGTPDEHYYRDILIPLLGTENTDTLIKTGRYQNLRYTQTVEDAKAVINECAAPFASSKASKILVPRMTLNG